MRPTRGWRDLGDAGEPAEGRRLRAFALPVLLLLALHATLAWLGRAPGVLTRRDDSRYLILARALRHGQYRDVMWPGAPYHHMYPPGYPLLLAAWGAPAGDRFGWLILLQIALSVGALALAFDAARRSLGPTVALAALVILAVNPELLAWSGEIASEGPLAFCFAAALWGATALRPGGRQLAVVLAASLAAPMMRTAGVVLPAAVVLVWLIERRFRDALVVCVASALVVGPLMLWTIADPTPVAGSSYAADLVVAPGGGGVRVASGLPPSMWGVLAHRVLTNAFYYPTQGIPWILPLPTIPGTIVDNVVGAALAVAALAVGAVADFGRFRLGVVVLLASAALLLAWPYQIARYVAPLLPLLVPLLVDGAGRAGSVLGDRAARASVLVATLVIAGAGAARSGAHVVAVAGCARGQRLPDERCVTPGQAGFFRAVRFVGDSLPPRARVLAAKSEPLYLYTGRPTAPTPMVSRLDSAGFWAAVRDMGVDYVLLGAPEEDGEYGLGPRLAPRCADLELVGTFSPRTYLFRIATPPGPAVTPAAGAAAPGAVPGAVSPGQSAGASASCAVLRRFQRPVAPPTPSPPAAGAGPRAQSAADTSTRLS